MPSTGVLLLAYGSPEGPDEVEPYFTHIRGGRTPSPEAVANLRARYEHVGGRTPLLQITQEVRAGLERELNEGQSDLPYRVYVGMKHWRPFAGDVMRQMAADGIRRIVALALAPHYSRISIGGYRRIVDEAQRELGDPFEIRFVESWHMEPAFLDLIADRVRTALAAFAPIDRKRTVAVFTAHSLPERIREWGDPYEAQLRESSGAVAARVRLPHWRVAWQSAGNTGEPWIGPDILEELESLQRKGFAAVLQVPIGFVSDHLEILYDIDVEASGRAGALGLAFARTSLPNASPDFVRMLAGIVASA